MYRVTLIPSFYLSYFHVSDSVSYLPSAALPFSIDVVLTLSTLQTSISRLWKKIMKQKQALSVLINLTIYTWSAGSKAIVPESVTCGRLMLTQYIKNGKLLLAISISIWLILALAGRLNRTNPRPHSKNHCLLNSFSQLFFNINYLLIHLYGFSYMYVLFL